MDRRLAWKLASAGAAAAAAMIIRRGLDSAWHRARGESPRRPVVTDEDWTPAILWAAGVGIVAGVGRLVARRGAASLWRRVAGADPSEAA